VLFAFFFRQWKLYTQIAREHKDEFKLRKELAQQRFNQMMKLQVIQAWQKVVINQKMFIMKY
jgi:hypothetical protein